MSTRYPGGFINRSAPVVVGPIGGEGGSAPGVWTLEQAGYYKSVNQWPTPIVYGSAWSWGSNAAGYLASGSTVDRSSPVQVGSLNTWRDISVGSAAGYNIDTSGRLWSWGNGASGALGDGTVTTKQSPIQVGALTNWAALAKQSGNATNFFSAIKSDKTLWSWGIGTQGQIGDGTTTLRSSPVQIGSNSWYQVSCGNAHTLAIKTDGTLWAWGSSAQGQLGLNIGYQSYGRSSPTQVGPESTWSSVSAGQYTSAAIRANGALFSWGLNSNGELGQGNKVYRSSPTQVGALTNWSQVAYGSATMFMIKTDGSLWGVGYNTQGQLGQNNVIVRSSPVQIGNLTTWSKVTANYAVGAIKTDGTLWTWGYNAYGPLGQNDTFNRSSPVQVGTDTNWGKVSIGMGTSSRQFAFTVKTG